MFIRSKIHRCPACSAVFGHITLEYMEPVFFQRGPRKGKVKEIVKVEKRLNIFSDSILRNTDAPHTFNIMKHDAEEGEEKKITLYSCPNCGAVFGEEFPEVYVSSYERRT